MPSIERPCLQSDLPRREFRVERRYLSKIHRLRNRTSAAVFRFDPKASKSPPGGNHSATASRIQLPVLYFPPVSE